MDAAICPERFKTDKEWCDWKYEYQRAYRVANRNRKKEVGLGLLPKRRRDHEKKRR